jgi:DNA-binding transcriptional ArsR family regulator
MNTGADSAEDIKKARAVLTTVGNKVRQNILALLNKQGKMSVTQLYVKLRQEQTIMSNHLSKLKKAGVVGVEVDGKYRQYYIISERLEEINAYAKALALQK